MEPDFGGYATKNDLKCTDGIIIRSGAFKHQDGHKVPLVWRHSHDTLDNVLGHAILQNRPEGVYAEGYFNTLPLGETAKGLVSHGDIKALSIYANGLQVSGKDVNHGNIREVSLVIAGANPGALIDFVNIVHSDGDFEVSESEAVIYSDQSIEIKHKEDTVAEAPSKTDSDTDSGETVDDIVQTMSKKQKDVLYYLIGAAADGGNEESVAQSDEDQDDLQHEGEQMTRNVFDNTDDGVQNTTTALSHDQIGAIVADAQKCGSFKEAFLAHAGEYGITNIDVLFPDAKKVQASPEWIKRRTEWVAGVISGTHHSPFSRIKSMSADITHEEARARGYVKTTLKKEEFFAVASRVTTPKTIYKKQKLDRDDIIDITDLDVVSWIKAEMRVMLDEEIARAILIGDGREFDHPDKIDEDKIRPIAKDDDFYAHKVDVTMSDTNSDYEEVVEAVIRSRKFYKGTGLPTFFTTEEVITEMLLLKDQLQRRMYKSVGELASELRVSNIIAVEAMESQPELIGVIVNLSDYTVGADRGGEISMFDDFDIDYNQYKYLLETRLSGALTKHKTALVIRRSSADNAFPVAPTYNATTGVVTINQPLDQGVDYFVNGVKVTTTGAQVAKTEDLIVEADASIGRVIPHLDGSGDAVVTTWAFAYTG